MKAQSRAILCLPAIQGFAGAILMLAGILGWGAAGRDYEPWLPTFAGMFIGGFVLVGAFLTFRGLRPKLDVPSRIRKPAIYFGVIATLLLAAFALFAATFVGNSDAYTQRRIDAETGLESYDYSLEPPGFVFFTILACIPGPPSWLVWAAYHYLKAAIDPISSEVEGLDPMGELMRKP